jgi:hypothetical protein
MSEEKLPSDEPPPQPPVVMRAADEAIKAKDAAMCAERARETNFPKVNEKLQEGRSAAEEN